MLIVGHGEQWLWIGPGGGLGPLAEGACYAKLKHLDFTH